MSSVVEVELIPNFFSCLPIVNPGVPFSTIKALIPFAFNSSAVAAQITATSASSPLVIKC